MTEIIKLYNPANAASLTTQDLEAMRNLTSAEIKELALAYPNLTMQRAYLLIADSKKPIDKQLLSLSTFENLWNLREKNAQRQYVAYAFKGNVKPRSVINPGAKKSEVLDLSESELMNLPGFKSANKVHPPEDVKVTKVRKESVSISAKPKSTKTKSK
jgi:hypothetical protein